MSEENQQIFRVVEDKERPGFPLKHFGHPVFDNVVFSMADQMIVDYNGGYWDYTEVEAEYCDLSGEKVTVGFMELHEASDKKVTILNPICGQSVETDTRLAGMIVSCYALLFWIEKYYSDDLAVKFEYLKDAILTYCSATKQMNVWMEIMD
jgi:hypothetical protein